MSLRPSRVFQALTDEEVMEQLESLAHSIALLDISVEEIPVLLAMFGEVDDKVDSLESQLEYLSSRIDKLEKVSEKVDKNG